MTGEYNQLVCPYPASNFGQAASTADPATLLGSSLCLEQLRSVLGRLLAAPGFGDGLESPSAALSIVSKILASALPCIVGLVTAVEFFGFVFTDAPAAFKAILRLQRPAEVPLDARPSLYALGITARGFLLE